MPASKITRIRSVSEFHQLRGLPAPEHPLISVVNYADVHHRPEDNGQLLMLDYYSIAVKRGLNGKLKYGQQEYDFDEGVMFFMSPGQVFGIEGGGEGPVKRSGWMLQIHPDFLWNTPLAKTIKKYDYFDYAVNEALFLSEKEEAIIYNLIQNIRQEYHTNIDRFSQGIILAQVETLLQYAQRFYQRQFITRQITNHHILTRLEALLDDYFAQPDLVSRGLPTVQYISAALHVSPNYLRGLLKTLTGQNTQQHIHDKLIEKAKEKLSTTELSVSEIAYELGFEHPQSFSKLFKTKTRLSPLAFRQSFG